MFFEPGHPQANCVVPVCKAVCFSIEDTLEFDTI